MKDRRIADDHDLRALIQTTISDHEEAENSYWPLFFAVYRFGRKNYARLDESMIEDVTTDFMCEVLLKETDVEWTLGRFFAIAEHRFNNALNRNRREGRWRNEIPASTYLADVVEEIRGDSTRATSTDQVFERFVTDDERPQRPGRITGRMVSMDQVEAYLDLETIFQDHSDLEIGAAIKRYVEFGVTNEAKAPNGVSQQIAHELGVPKDTVKSALRRSLARARMKLAREGLTDSDY